MKQYRVDEQLVQAARQQALAAISRRMVWGGGNVHRNRAYPDGLQKTILLSLMEFKLV
jgi:hypothetical protein